jgi:pimeloyl-ACP methyl ester carboxylesterase
MVARDRQPTGVSTEDYWLRFRVPPGLMPDRQFDGRPARLRVHRVRPVYGNSGRSSVPTRAVVLIHGRTVPGPVVFDLRDRATGGGALQLSVQNALAWAGIDTFAPSLLGYGESTRFGEGLDDPGNASLPGYTTGGICTKPDPGCDRTLNTNINPLDQQQNLLLGNHPLDAMRRHSSNFRFARTDVWVRDIDQVIDDAITRNRRTYGGAGPDGKKVTLVGYSVGGQHVGRTLYADNQNEQLLYADDDVKVEDLHNRENIIDKVGRVVFLNSFFGVLPGQPGVGPTEEPANPFGPPTFPLTLDTRAASDFLWRPVTAAACTGRIIPGTQDRVWAQTMENDTVGRAWGNPPGLNRSPTFSGYGWNLDVAEKLSKPTLVIQGLEDGILPTGPTTGRFLYDNLYKDLPAYPRPKKVLVEVECASHVLQWEGCDGAGCTPHYVTLQKALIEWIKSGTFNNGAPSGIFNVNRSGVVATVSTP